MSTATRMAIIRSSDLGTEAFVAAANLSDIEHGSYLFTLQAAADDIVRPLHDRPVRVDRETLTHVAQKQTQSA